MSICRRVRLDILDPAAIAQATGFPARGGIYRTTHPVDGLVFDGAAMTTAEGPSPDGDELPLLPPDFEAPDPRPLHPRGEDPSPAMGRVRCAAASRALGTPKPPGKAPTWRSFASDAADLYFGFGVPGALAVQDFRAKSYDGATYGDLAKNECGVDLESVFSQRYAEGSPNPWGAFAGEAEAEYQEREEERRRAREEHQRAEAKERERLPLDVAGADAFFVADSSFALETANPRVQDAAHHYGLTLATGQIVVAIATGVRLPKDVTLSTGVRLLTPESAADILVPRSELRRVHLLRALESAHNEWVLDLVLAHSPFDASPLADEDCRTLKTSATRYAIERASAEADLKMPLAMRELSAMHSRVVVRARWQIADLFRAPAIHPELAVLAIVERCAAYWEGRSGRAPWGSESAVREIVRDVYTGGRTTVTAGSVIETPPAPWTDRFFTHASSVDPWKKAARAFLEGRSDARNEELENELVGRTMTPTERPRLAALMGHLGWTKRRRSTEDGKSVRVWVPSTTASEVTS